MIKRAIITILTICGAAHLSATVADSVSYSKNIDRIEVSARKTQDAALTKTSIDSAVLAQKNNITLAELLTENTTLFLKHYGKGSEATASFRGTAPSHTQVYWNGLKVNSPISGYVDFSNIPMFFVSEVNLYHGISSVQNGTGALGGSIEMRSRADWENRFSASLAQAVGSFSTYDTYINVKAGNEKFQSATKAFFNTSKNDFTFVNRHIIEDPSGERYHPKMRNRNADYSKGGFMQEFFARPSEREVVSVVVWGMAADRNMPFLSSYEGGEDQNVSNQKDKNLRASANYKRYGQKADYEFIVGGDIQDLKFNQKSRIATGYLTQIDSHGKSYSVTAAANISVKFSETQTLSLSTNASHVNIDSNEDVKNQGFQKGRFEGSQLVGLHSRWTERLSSSAMLRAVVVGGKACVVPVIGAEYVLNKSRSLSAMFNIGRNNNDPSLSDLYYLPGGNPDLKNETGMSYEAGLNLRRTLGRHRITAQLNAYYSDIKNWIIWLPSPKQYWTPENVKRVKASGIELKVTEQYKSGDFTLFATATVGYTRSINQGEPRSWGDESIGKQLPYIPRYSANLFAKAEYRKFYAGWQFSYYSRRHTTTSNDKSNFSSLAPYYMNDIFGGKHFGKHFSAELRVLNLFNRSYETVLNRPMPGQNFLLTAKIYI